MRKYSIKQFALVLSCLAACSSSFADNTPAASPGSSTNAVAFGIQAGQIAGAAQACGIDVSTFTVRVSEAINKLALNPADKTAATSSFQQSLGQAQAMQTANHPIACSQVTQDFNSLPLLRADYEQSVISQLNPGMTGNNNSTQSNTTTNQNQQANTATNQNQQNQQQTNNPNTTTTQPGNTNNAANNNPAYGSPTNPGYGAYSPTRNNYDNAINSLNTTNQQSLNQTQSSGSSSQSTNANTQQNNANAQTNTTNTNNPPPPSYTNPNNTAPATTGGY